jgi:uncharacterized protein YehS (DUF1456 family)
MSIEFNTLIKYIDDLRHRYYKTLSAFYAYEGLRELKATNILGATEAEANVKTMNAYKEFFQPTEEALRVYFFLELAKLFDASNQSLHIDKIVNFTESNLKHLTADAFKDYNTEQGREFLNNLTEEYKGVDHADLVEIRESLKAHNEALEKLRVYRDKWLAHEDIKKPELPDITGIELRALFKLLEKILNSLTSKLNSSSTLWDHVEKDVKHHVNLVIDHLRRFEPYRLKEIEEEYNNEVK